MKLGLFNSALNDRSFDEACRIISEMGVQMIELGVGGVSYSTHVEPDVLLSDPSRMQDFIATIEKHGLGVSALSCHGNPLHPSKGAREKYDKAMRDAVLLAEKMGVDTINCFSGCPGDNPDAKHPNWICVGQSELGEVLEWQWESVAIPYWREFASFAKAHSVNKIAIEMYASMLVYNTETLFRLRDAVGSEIGCNFDPTHIVWQGMKPVTVIRALGDAIFHVHGKDAFPNRDVIALNGILDQRPYWGDEKNRAWVFRTVGYGFDLFMWREIINALLMIGYDGTISIEHEDALFDQIEGIQKSVDFFKDVIPFEKPGAVEWRNSIAREIYEIEHS